MYRAKIDFHTLRESTNFYNWDDEQAPPISHWDSAEDFYRKMNDTYPSFPVHQVSPCGDGSIHFYWIDGNETIITAELFASGKVVSYSYSAEKDYEYYDDLDKSAFSEFFSRFVG